MAWNPISCRMMTAKLHRFIPSPLVLIIRHWTGTRPSLRYRRAQYVAITDDEAVAAFEYLSRMEGVIPAIESAHAVAYAMKLAPTLPKDKIIVICLSGRGDKDVAAIARYKGVDLHD